MQRISHTLSTSRHASVERLPGFEAPKRKQGAASVQYASGTLNMDAVQQAQGELPLTASVLPFGLKAPAGCDSGVVVKTPLYHMLAGGSSSTQK